MGLPYLIYYIWGGFGGQCRHIWQSHGVSGYVYNLECALMTRIVTQVSSPKSKVVGICIMLPKEDTVY